MLLLIVLGAVGDLVWKICCEKNSVKQVVEITVPAFEQSAHYLWASFS